MNRPTALMLLVAVATAGCGKPPSAADPLGKITWKEYRKMPPEDQAGPYALHHLDDNARKKLADATGRPRK